MSTPPTVVEFVEYIMHERVVRLRPRRRAIGAALLGLTSPNVLRRRGSWHSVFVLPYRPGLNTGRTLVLRTPAASIRRAARTHAFEVNRLLQGHS